jgi:hypothetical protein
VYRRRAIHGDVCDHAAPHEIEKDGRQSRLDDVAAEHDYNAPLRSSGVGNCVDHPHENAGRENIG